MDILKKLAAILDERSILNFRFVIQLFYRYKFIALGAPFITMIIALTFYKNQNQIHSGSISFWYVKEKESNPANPLSALMSDDSNSLSPAEVLGVLESTNFQHVLAKSIYESGEADKLNFNSINSKSRYTWQEFTENCDNEKCVLNFIRKKAPQLFSAKMDDFIPNRYMITVKALDRHTTDFIVEMLARTIEKYRADTTKHQLRNQIKVTQKLLTNQKAEIERLQISKIQAEKKILESTLEGHIKKMDIFNEILEEKTVELDQVRISLKHTKNSLEQTITLEDKEQLSAYQNLTMRKKLLMADITSLEYSMGNRSSQDSEVIKSLNDEMEKINNSLKDLRQTRTIASLEQFQNERQNSKELIEFNMNVLNDQITDLDNRTNKLDETKNKLITKIRDKNELIENNRTILEYYKLLQSKLLKLQLQESTIVSDLVFEDYLDNAHRYKRYSLALVIPFALILSILITFMIILTRYILDNRLMNEEEFKNVFDELPVIGTVPGIITNSSQE